MRSAFLLSAVAAAALALGADPAGAQKFPAGQAQVGENPVINPELLYEPIAACRAFDTHASEPLTAARTFAISGNGNLKSQGGPKTGCGIPASASAVTIALGTSDASDPGALSAYPRRMPTQALAAAYAPSVPTVTGATVQLSKGQLTLSPSAGSVQVTGDVTGYFAPQIQAFVGDQGNVFAGTTRIVSVTHTDTGVYQIIADRDVLTCAANVTSAVPNTYATGVTTVLGLTVRTFALSGDAPVAADTEFNVTITC